MPHVPTDLAVARRHWRVRRLCEATAGMAQALLRRRAELGPVAGACQLEPLWSPARQNGRVRSSGAWHAPLDRAFSELESLARTAEASLCALVEADPRIAVCRPVLHQLRAVYEYDKELAVALALRRLSDAPLVLSRLLADEIWWALSPELCDILRNRRRVVFAGSGPLPLTALAIARCLDLPVLCIERDAEAVSLSREMIALAGLRGLVRCRRGDAAEVALPKDADAVISAVLVGVDRSSRRRHRRQEVAARLWSRLPPGAAFILRQPHGLGTLFHPALDLAALEGAEARLLLPPVGAALPYRSALAVIERCGAAP